ncbi:MAG: RNA-binding transcriptional accessory protein [Oscillospiraceae bacterium]|nr:RNA-binding transcriptional accessory protein [Oscillospiraceae bacterium]
MDIVKILSEEFSLKEAQLTSTLALIDEGNTIPFIARYRKEVTGSLDDIVLRDLNDRLEYLRSLEKRKNEVTALITEQGKMTPEIEAAIEAAKILTEVEDIYRPFKPHRKTRASVAREKGLEPLAALIIAQTDTYERPIPELAEDFVDEEKGVLTADDAINGACDIIAEDISDNADYRKSIRMLTFEHGVIQSKRIGNAESVYEMYYDYKENVGDIPGHRILALNRGEKEEFLKIDIVISPDIILNYLFGQVITNSASPAKKYVSNSIVDSYERLIAPSIEREIRTAMFDTASEGAIKLFADNLKNLLMGAPVKGKTVIGFDPGYRTGCKLAVVDKTGKVLDTAVIYPTKPQERTDESKKIIKRLINTHDANIIAIGNGTASKESEIFVADMIKELETHVKYIVVSEAGASVYSASKLGAEEFPDYDVTQRSAVSIARRLQDPLAELVKIDPKSIGVGQYQHDMKPARLDQALSGVVEDCVNKVGVDVNTASYSLLSYVAGINSAAAKNIVKYRDEKGEFKSRAEILNVPRIGAKAFEQCAGFLRVSGSSEILDNTGVHPESYAAAKKILDKFKTNKLKSAVAEYGMKNICAELEIGEPTLNDIITELEKPGRDIRDDLPLPVLRDDIMDLADLKPDMILTGTVRNVIDFGVFVDIGVHQDGLLHVSEISKGYIKHPSEKLSVGDIIKVKVKSVDLNKKRIALTMKEF